ncbi:MAG: diacylglycerol kinase family protein [Weeksellaceae bacterium]
MKYHAKSIKHALEGLHWAFKTQPNFRVHIILSIFSIIAGIICMIAYEEWLIVGMFIMMGFVIETINTAIEQLGDAIDKDYNIIIKRAKDLGAGAMFIVAIGASITAAIIFLPKILVILS